jgi:glucosamine-6-phosphate deaminase
MSQNDGPAKSTEASDIHLHRVADYVELSHLAADIVTRVIQENPSDAVTLPTGETPRGMYEELTRRIERGDLDFSSIHFFCLDEYLGKGIDDRSSLTSWLDAAFLTPAGLHGDNIHFIPSTAPNPKAAAADYDKAIADRGGLKLAVVGLGFNGHIAFNEPGSAIDSRTRVVNLTDESRDQNAAYYDGAETIPRQAITIGLGTILESELIVLIVSGASKAAILKTTLKGPITEDVPGSFLRTVGDRLIVIADRDAASSLS